ADRLLLMARVVPPATLSGKQAELQANVKWLACKDVCIPGEANLRLTLPVKSEEPAKSAAADLFVSARAKLVRETPSAWKVSAEKTQSGFRLAVSGIDGSGDVAFFPLHKREIDNGAPQKISRSGQTVTLDLKRSELMEEPPKALEGLVVTGE